MSPTRDAPRFGQVITAMVTPFDEAGALNLDGAVELARYRMPALQPSREPP